MIYLPNLKEFKHFKYVCKDYVFSLPLLQVFLYITDCLFLFIFLFMSHHLEPLSSAESLIDLSLGEMVFRSAVGSQLDGLLRGWLNLLVQLIELLGQ